jgi:L-ascorbate metabolism protein UlaG (beta-lactamase superfamily)
MDGIRVLHLGDLGHMPDEDLVKRIGQVDLLLLPVGGTYTIDAKTARQVLDLFAPSVCIPMHYKTDALRFEIDGLDGFLEIVRDLSVHRLNEPSCTLCPGALGAGRVVLLDYKKQ